MAKKTVFITGGTGNMGWAAVQEMLKKPSEINIKTVSYTHLTLPTKLEV